jgi:Up-regulated During Septation
LDERTEYLRRTYTSLRAGRRNLHTRICQYLRSPRTAKFSHDSILKQEEALAELDASIDDWVTKLEQAENRRTRVRQKLLEHVAAAVTLSTSAGAVAGVSESLQLAMGVRPLNSSNGAGNISTPPRSPVKTGFTSNVYTASPSPQRVVAQVPSTIIEQPLFEEAATAPLNTGTKEEAAISLRRAETIRIYADNDVYALLADVENAISKMSSGGDISPSKGESPSGAERRNLHRTRSSEAMSSSPKRASPSRGNTEKSSPRRAPSSATPTPPPPDAQNGEIFLTNAVFRPERS